MPFATLSPCYHNLVNRLLIYSSYGQLSFFIIHYGKKRDPCLQAIYLFSLGALSGSRQNRHCSLLMSSFSTFVPWLGLTTSCDAGSESSP